MSDENKIIAVVGLCGSGKSIVCEHIEKNGYKKIYFGAIVIDEVKKRGLKIIEENEKKVREELRETYGMFAMAIKSKDKIDTFLKAGHDVLIDGLYSMSEYRVLIDVYTNMTMIAVFTPKKLRYKRLTERKIRPLTKEEAEQRDFDEIDNIEKGGPIAIADYTVINDGSVKHLTDQVDAILQLLWEMLLM